MYLSLLGYISTCTHMVHLARLCLCRLQMWFTILPCILYIDWFASPINPGVLVLVGVPMQCVLKCPLRLPSLTKSMITDVSRLGWRVLLDLVQVQDLWLEQ